MSFFLRASTKNIHVTTSGTRPFQLFASSPVRPSPFGNSTSIVWLLACSVQSSSSRLLCSHSSKLQSTVVRFWSSLLNLCDSVSQPVGQQPMVSQTPNPTPLADPSLLPIRSNAGAKRWLAACSVLIALSASQRHENVICNFV